MTDWQRVKERRPPEGEVVDTIGSNGTAQPLKLVGRLWFVPDGSMYVYYEPQLWRKRETEKVTR